MKKRILGLVLGAAVVVAAGACNPNLSSFTVLGLIPPSNECVFSGSSTVFLPGVTIDLNVARRSQIALLARNSMVSSFSAAARLTELRTILVEGANVRFRTEGFTQLPQRYSFASASIAPSLGTSPILVELLTTRDIDVLRGDARLQAAVGTGRNVVTILANIKLDGRITDGNRIQSSEVAVPIRICKGCLQGPAPVLSAPAPGQPTPTLEEFCRTQQAVLTCFPGQDEFLDYCSYETLRR